MQAWPGSDRNTRICTWIKDQFGKGICNLYRTVDPELVGIGLAWRHLDFKPKTFSVRSLIHKVRGVGNKLVKVTEHVHKFLSGSAKH